MKNERKEFTSKLKYYHTIILGLILSSLLIFNSNNVNSQRAQNKLNIEKSRLFDKIISGRNLEGEEDKKSDTDQVCERGSEELRSYYKSGNLGDIKLEDGSIKSEDKDKDYMKAIINIIKSQLGGGKNEDGEGDEDHGAEEHPETDPLSGSRRNLQNEEGENDDLSQNVMTYGKHILPVLIFLVIGILCIPGWLMCCFCCCCNCCCCCCCKKPCCKIPCFVITFALYALVVAVCFYGLTQSNKIFVGIADTECSILRFFDEILIGESKETLPKWAGIDGIQTLLDNIKDSLIDIKDHSMIRLNEELNSLDADNGPKKTFLDMLTNADQYFYPSNSYINAYTQLYSFPDNTADNVDKGYYVLDIIQKFGKYNPSKKEGYPEASTIWSWVQEYKIVADTADEKLQGSKNDFDEIFNNQFGEFTSALDDGKEKIGELKTTFNDFKAEISGMIVDYSETIDNYGKLGFKIIFGVLALLNIAIAVFMLLLCLCSGKCCTKCCCCRCICKLFTHLLWNILALLMIIVFLVGSLFSIIGKIGKDGMNVISYIVSEDNIGEGGDNILVDQIGDSVKYLRRCLILNGSIEVDLDLGQDKLNHLDDIRVAEGQIENATIEFEKNKQMVVYNKTMSHLENITTKLKSDLPFGFILNRTDGGNPVQYLEFNEILKLINENDLAISNNEKFDVSCDLNLQCNGGTIPDGTVKCFHPTKHVPSERTSWINQDSTLTLYAKIIDDIKAAITKANTLEISAGGYKTQLEELGKAYDDFLDGYIDALKVANATIKTLTNKIKEYTGEDGGMFSFINCSFIKTNLKIILKYLKEVLGGNLYTIGVCLILVGCSLALSISFTILLIIVINADIDSKKKAI